jgi:hypothetical protein
VPDQDLHRTIYPHKLIDLLNYPLNIIHLLNPDKIIDRPDYLLTVESKDRLKYRKVNNC